MPFKTLYEHGGLSEHLRDEHKYIVRAGLSLHGAQWANLWREYRPRAAAKGLSENDALIKLRGAQSELIATGILFHHVHTRALREAAEKGNGTLYVNPVVLKEAGKFVGKPKR